MSTEMIAGLIGFVVLFGLWVILPSVIHKKHNTEVEDE